MNSENKGNKTAFRYKVAKNTAAISGILFLLLGVLLIANYIQTSTRDPLNSQAFDKLMERLEDNPDDTQLKEEIRALDLLARKAYFTNKWQVRTGSYILFAFAVIFLISLKSLSSLKAHLPELEEKNNSDTLWQNKMLSKKYVVYSGLTIFIVALLAAVLTENNLEADPSQKEVAVSEPAETEEPKQEFQFVDLKEKRENWPAFRGPEGLGIAYSTEVPVEWNGAEGKNIKWKTEIPLKGFNSPIIWGDKIFLSGADDNNLAVFCFSAEDGKLLWEHKLNDIPGSPNPRPKVMDYTGYAAPSLTTDGKNVYAIFGTGDIACIDFSGKRKWGKNLAVPVNHYGHSSSLILYDKTLIVQLDQNTDKHIIGLEAETGNQIYKTVRNTEISWASPILINTGERAEVVLSSNPDIVSYDPLTGKELWRFKCMSGEVGPSPAYADGVVYACNDYAKLAAIQLGETPKLLWESEDDLSEVASPVATKDIVVMAASYGTLSCLDSKTGESLWIYEADEGFYSSPMIVGDKIYVMEVSGRMNVLEAGKELKVISQNDLGEKASTIPAFYKNKIYIRGENNLYCIGS